MFDYININNINGIKEKFITAKPFSHVIIDDFFNEETADNLEKEFIDYDSSHWHRYHNAIEVKKTCNNWNIFPELTYKVFSYLNSTVFIDRLAKETGIKNLTADFGLNGGGWHIHSKGGKLNTHLDYSLHPKLKKQRKLNLIVYLTKDWSESWGGHLGLWSHNAVNNQPDELVNSVAPLFNRAVIFDTTQHSWHGLPEAIQCSEGEYRKSIAVYYLTDADQTVDTRGKALFSPYKKQKDDKDILELIKKRSTISTAENVYEEKSKK